MATIIGLTGRKQSGKDTSASYLIENCGFQRLAFADALKDVVCTANPIIHVLVNDEGSAVTLRAQDAIDSGMSLDEIKETYPEFRRFMTILATEAIRKYREDFWIDIVLDQLSDPDGKYVITDVRFPNEAAALRSRAGDSVQLWYVQSDRAEATPATHESERWAGRLGEDRIIRNNGNLTELNYRLRDLCRIESLV